MINYTPHAIVIRSQDGTELVLPPSGTVARVSMTETSAGEHAGIPVIRRETGQVTGLQRDEQGFILPCIVSSMVLSSLPVGTSNVWAPDTGPTAIRDERGHVVAVTRLVAS